MLKIGQHLTAYFFWQNRLITMCKCIDIIHIVIFRSRLKRNSIFVRPRLLGYLFCWCKNNIHKLNEQV